MRSWLVKRAHRERRQSPAITFNLKLVHPALDFVGIVEGRPVPLSMKYPKTFSKIRPDCIPRHQSIREREPCTLDGTGALGQTMTEWRASRPEEVLRIRVCVPGKGSLLMDRRRQNGVEDAMLDGEL